MYGGRCLRFAYLVGLGFIVWWWVIAPCWTRFPKSGVRVQDRGLLSVSSLRSERSARIVFNGRFFFYRFAESLTCLAFLFWFCQVYCQSVLEGLQIWLLYIYIYIHIFSPTMASFSSVAFSCGHDRTWFMDVKWLSLKSGEMLEIELWWFEKGYFKTDQQWNTTKSICFRRSVQEHWSMLRNERVWVLKQHAWSTPCQFWSLMQFFLNIFMYIRGMICFYIQNCRKSIIQVFSTCIVYSS